MFGWLRRDPRKKLEDQYARMLVQARDAQRNGNIQGFADLMAEAETILLKIDACSETVDDVPES